MTDSLTNKINDLRKLAEERRGGSNALVGSQYGNEEPTVTIVESKEVSQRTLSAVKSSKPFTPNRKTQQPSGMVERPASRVEIQSLEHELEERVRLVLDMNASVKRGENEFSDGYSFEPHREAMMVVRDRMLADFGIDSSMLHMEPWLDSFIKCECLKVMCDDVSSKFADMLAIHSVELGSVLRKLRLTYKQCFEQMHSSWKTLRGSYLEHTSDLSLSRDIIKKLQGDLENKENEMNKKFDNEVNRLNAEFNAEKARDQEKLLQTEFKMDQMSDTLKYLNGIFRTMQSDGATVKTADLQAKCYRLEKENFTLQEQNSSLETVNAALAKAEARVKQLEKEQRQHTDEIFRLKHQLERREEVVKGLMEKEALRNAEIEKLQKMSKLKDDELVAVDLKDSATSVLCIKCKKSLDDLSNIRSAILGDNSTAGKVAKMQCEAFRILLPNLKGRQPNRNSKWLRVCMRSILLSKLKEDVHLQFIKGQCTRFPAYVYAWYVRKTEGRSSGSQLSKLLAAADEDRWGLYYGVKALSKDDPESLVFWSLLDETYGEDGMQFMMYCLSVLLSIGGATLWKQFGTAMDFGSNINVKPTEDKNVLDVIWLDIFTAKEAVKLILVRALAAHIADAMDAIDALKVRPSDDELETIAQIMRDDKKRTEQSTKGSQDAADDAGPATDSDVPTKDPAMDAAVRASNMTSSAEPTHINLFMWLRLMLQQIHADQIQRSAAVRLMFETASVGALTPQGQVNGSGNQGGNNGGDHVGPNAVFGATGTHVEYPQFQSICLTLFPHVPIAETAVLYANCFDVGQRRVNSEIFVKVADRQGLFAHALKLPLLPLLKQVSSYQQKIESAKSQAGASVSHFRLGEVSEDKAADASTANAHSGASISDMFTLRTEQAVRSKLATMVHRKLAAVTPSITNMLQSLPERWHTVIEDAMDAVKVSLADSHQKLQQQVNEQISHSYNKTAGHDRVTMDESKSQRPYIDGIQPFVAYRRLLLLGSLVKTICDNPLLPTELFSAGELDNNVVNIDHAMFRAEKLLSSIEQGFLLAPAGATGKGNTFLGLVDKYHSFEAVRTTLVARRLQNLFRKFLNRDFVVPRTVRLNMSPGYLGMYSFATATIETPVPKYATRSVSTMPAASSKVSVKAPPAVTISYEKLYLRNREVYHEPWWGQALLAEVYRYKITYDAKAASLGLNPISLAHAVTASQYYLWGTMEAAETKVHDLFQCVRAYRLGVPRLRLFAAFLGDGRDLDEPVAEMLRTPHALSVYLTLLIEIHRELHREQQENLRNQQLRANQGSATELGALVDVPVVTTDCDTPPVMVAGENCMIFVPNFLICSIHYYLYLSVFVNNRQHNQCVIPLHGECPEARRQTRCVELQHKGTHRRRQALGLQSESNGWLAHLLHGAAGETSCELPGASRSRRFPVDHADSMGQAGCLAGETLYQDHGTD